MRLRNVLATAAIGCTISAAQACGSDGTGPQPPTGPKLAAGLRIVEGASGTDTIGATISPVVAQLADSTGRPIANRLIHFAVRPVDGGATPSFPMFLTALPDRIFPSATEDISTDSLGRARVSITFLTRPGSADLDVTTIGVTVSAHYSILPGNPASITLSPTDTVLYVGAADTLRTIVLDRAKNSLGALPAYSVDDSAASVSPTGVVTAETLGRATLTAQAGNVVAHAALSVVPSGTITAVRWDGQYNIAVASMRLDGSAVTEVYNPGFGGVFGDWTPTWSPDGAQIAFVGQYPDDRIHVANLPAIAHNIVPSGTTFDHAPVYSPDGAWIYFSAHPSNLSHVILFRVHPDGTALDSLTGYNGDFELVDDWPLPSPDGSQLAFVSNRATGHRIHFLDLTTGALSATFIQATSVRWGPGGDVLAYLAPDGATLHLVHTDGGGDRVLLTATSVEPGFAWSPDGTWIIARADARPTLIRVSDGFMIPIPALSAYREPSWR